MARVHPTAVIGSDVQLGERVAIGPHAVLLGRCRIGDDCWLGPGVIIGTPPEVASVPHEAGWSAVETAGTEDGADAPGVVIGAGTVLRELTMVHRGWQHETRIGANCYLMNKVYIGHDGWIEDDVTMASTATLGGHVRVGHRTNLGMGATVHQRRVIGPGAMVGMSAVVSRDVPPFSTVFGNPARLQGINSVGMTRAGIGQETIDSVRSAYERRQLPDTAGMHQLATDAFGWWIAAEPQRPLF
jgi:UDP-N-acetylglucosamine acyltransferase